MIVYILFAKSKNTMMQCIEWFTNNNYNILDLEVEHNNYKFQVAEVKNDLIQVSINRDKEIDALVTIEYINALNSKNLLYAV